MTDPMPASLSSAGALFDDHLRRRDAGEDVDFEALCSAHPALAGELRSLFEANAFLSRLLPGPLRDDSTSQESAKHDPSDVSFHSRKDDSHLADGPTTELWEKVRAAGPRGARYRTLGEIARGGMGVILHVFDDELRRKLAMKVARGRNTGDCGKTSAVDARTLGRFLEEAQVTGQLDHPGIVPVHEIGLGIDGGVYYTMRLVDGVNLREIFSRVQSNADGWNQVRAIGVMLKVCEAMSYAHSKGVIHRDLKPANVMVGRFGEVYVMDWGLARVIGGADRHDLRIRLDATAVTNTVETDRHDERAILPDSPLVTMDGDVVGTPSYMSPEQANGQIETLGPHSDVYSVGAMLYELISGEMPFVARDTPTSSRAVLDRLIEGPPRPLHEFGRTAPPELVAICEKAMSRSIVERYRDMQALADDLRAYVEGHVVRAYETGTWAETRKWVRRNRALSAAFAGVAFTFVAGIVASLVFLNLAQSSASALREQNEVFMAVGRLQEFRRYASEWGDAKELERSAREAWLDRGRAIVDGSGAGDERKPGLDDFLAQLETLNARADSTVDPASYPHAAELVSKRLWLDWYQRMLGEKLFPNEQEVAAQMAREESFSDAKKGNYLAWRYVDPRRPMPGHEIEGLVLARRALDATIDPEVRLPSLNTLAWALFRVHRFDEAVAREAEAIPDPANPPRDIWTIPRIHEETRDWQDGTAMRIRDELAHDVARLAANQAAWRRPLADSGLETLHRQLTGLVVELERLHEHVEQVERTIASESDQTAWQVAIEAIERHPRYHRTMTPQLDLLPLGEDPESKLWEFAHLPSGEPPVRGADGKLELRRETGLVFVLLPGGKSTVPTVHDVNVPIDVDLEWFFLSKYEMTQNQWERLDHAWPPKFVPERTLQPAMDVSWNECMTLLRETGGWLNLPTEAQWNHASRAGNSTRWWTGDFVDSLNGAENLCFDSRDPDSGRPFRIGSLRANGFGLYDMLGNVHEWVQDASNCIASPRIGDGLRIEPNAPQHVALGADWSFGPQTMEGHRTSGGAPDERVRHRGFRPARPVTP